MKEKNTMNKNKKNLILAVLTMVITGGILLLINYFAVTYCMENLSMFTVLIVVVPIIGVGIAAFIIGVLIKWNVKKSICIAGILTLISFGTGQTIEPQSVLNDSSEDELMEELYTELDEKAYEYMLEAGLIMEGERIYSEEGVNNDVFNNSEIAYSGMYVGIQKADPATELLGNILTFFITFGLNFAGGSVKNKFLTRKFVPTDQSSQVEEIHGY